MSTATLSNAAALPSAAALPNAAVHPTHQLFFDTFQRWPESSSLPLLDLGVESLALIGFLCRIERELAVPLDRLLGSSPLTLDDLAAEYDHQGAVRQHSAVRAP